jgi:hypothetical protein
LTGFTSTFEDFGNLKALETKDDYENETFEKINFHETMLQYSKMKDRDMKTLLEDVFQI